MTSQATQTQQNSSIMNTNTFKIIVRQSTGTLERILRLVRHRGFEVHYCLAQEENLEDAMSITLQLSSERCSDNLFKQLQKLVDVVEIRLADSSKLRRCLGNE